MMSNVAKFTGGQAFVDGLRIAVPLIESKELQDERFLEQVGWFPDDLAFLGEFPDPLFVPAEGEAFVEARVELAFEFAERPILFSGLYLIKAGLFWVLDAEEEDVVRPA
jgi:hypothetical protein